MYAVLATVVAVLMVGCIGSEKETYDLSITISGQGTVVAPNRADRNSIVAIRVTSGSFVRWEGAAASELAEVVPRLEYSIRMTGPKQLVAIFEQEIILQDWYTKEAIGLREFDGVFFLNVAGTTAEGLEQIILVNGELGKVSVKENIDPHAVVSASIDSDDWYTVIVNTYRDGQVIALEIPEARIEIQRETLMEWAAAKAVAVVQQAIHRLEQNNGAAERQTLLEALQQYALNLDFTDYESLPSSDKRSVREGFIDRTVSTKSEVQDALYQEIAIVLIHRAEERVAGIGLDIDLDAAVLRVSEDGIAPADGAIDEADYVIGKVLDPTYLTEWLERIRLERQAAEVAVTVRKVQAAVGLLTVLDSSTDQIEAVISLLDQARTELLQLTEADTSAPPRFAQVLSDYINKIGIAEGLDSFVAGEVAAAVGHQLRINGDDVFMEIRQTKDQYERALMIVDLLLARGYEADYLGVLAVARDEITLAEGYRNLRNTQHEITTAFALAGLISEFFTTYGHLEVGDVSDSAIEWLQLSKTTREGIAARLFMDMPYEPFSLFVVALRSELK